MAGDSLRVSTGMQGATPDLARQAPEAVSNKNAINTREGYACSVIPLHVPDNSLRSKMVLSPQV